jgi:hypothetical protein
MAFVAFLVVPKATLAGSVCMNVDAALFPNEHHIGWGAVLHDRTRAFILSCSEGLSGLSDFHSALSKAFILSMNVFIKYLYG